MQSSKDTNKNIDPVFKDHEEDKNYVEKLTPKERLFRFIDKTGELIILNFIFVLTCIPIITIGASIVALLTETNRMVNNKEVYVVKEYFTAFKENFKKATILWILQLIAIIAIYLQLAYYVDPSRSANSPLKYFIPLEILIFTIAVPFQFPLVARYENIIPNYIINSFVYAALNFFHLLSLISPLFLVGFLYYTSPSAFVYTWYLWIVLFTGLLFYYYSVVLKRLYAKIEAPKPEADDDDADADDTGDAEVDDTDDIDADDTGDAEVDDTDDIDADDTGDVEDHD